MIDGDNAFCVGDTHGHLDRLELLLETEGLLDDGYRQRPDVQVIQLGDLCHLGTQTAQEDREILTVAPDWLDVILWGNHDRAIVSQYHNFGGYRWSYYGDESFGEEKPWFQKQYFDLERAGKLKLAHEKHGFLLTHAGLHSDLVEKHMSAETAARWLNEEVLPNDSKHPARDAVSFTRGGSHHYGGVLWRDAKEDLYGGFPQVFGHTAFPSEVREYEFTIPPDDDIFISYCIDVGTKDNGKLAGIWLPSCTVVQIDTHPDSDG